MTLLVVKRILWLLPAHKIRENNLQNNSYMRVGLIRHFPVDHLFLRGWVKQSRVLQWFREYNEAAVQGMHVEVGASWHVCYSSQLQRAKKTAEAVYAGEVIYTNLLNEPFPDPVFRSDIKMPFMLWALLIRCAILWNHGTQSHRKEVLEARIRELMPDILRHADDNVLIVSHAFTMEILSRFLLQEGFSGRKLRRPENGVLYLFERA